MKTGTAAMDELVEIPMRQVNMKPILEMFRINGKSYAVTFRLVSTLFFIPATWIGTFAAFLTCLFILATGLTILETIANPYTTVLGPPVSGAARINLAQTCNALGTFFGPLVAGAFILSSTSTWSRLRPCLKPGISPTSADQRRSPAGYSVSWPGASSAA